MGPRWGQRAGPADLTRLNAWRLSSVTSANKFNPSASPSEKRKVAGSIPALATSEAIFALKVNVTRRLFVGYTGGQVQHIGHLGMHLSSAHVDVLSHRRPRVAELVGPDPRRQPAVVDERGHGLAEAVR